MNRIRQLFEKKNKEIFSVFVTAGFPKLNDTPKVVVELEKKGVDMVEIGMPFSDPLADGETIQETSKVALENGMNIDLLFEQIEAIRSLSQIPIVLMGYCNPVLRFGLEKFLTACQDKGVDGLIIPDIGLEAYEDNYLRTFEKFDVPFTFLFTPLTSPERIRRMASHTSTFLYFVSGSSTTGKEGNFASEQHEEFKRIQAMNIDVPVLMGFGIHNSTNFKTATAYFNGGIIGSAFLRSLGSGEPIEEFLMRMRS